MLEEEEDVDIDGKPEDLANGASEASRQNGDQDEDTLWALEEPDDDDALYVEARDVADDETGPPEYSHGPMARDAEYGAHGYPVRDFALSILILSSLTLHTGR